MSSPEELRRLAEELLLIADRDSGFQERPHRQTGNDPGILADPDFLLQLANAIYRTRQIRARHVPIDFLGEPAWDILLDLFIAKRNGKRESITSACIASQVAPTTALRWIGLLVADGWTVRERDETDQRRSLLRLSNKGETAVTHFLTDASMSIRPISKRSSIFSWPK